MLGILTKSYLCGSGAHWVTSLLFILSLFSPHLKADFKARCAELLSQVPVEIEETEDARVHRLEVFEGEHFVASSEFRTFHIQPWHMYLDWIGTSSSYQKQGISGLVFDRVLRECPKVTQISAVLAYTNLSVFESVYQRGPAVEAFDRCKEAFRQTPLYRVLAARGFTRIVECEKYRNSVLVGVQR